jgi:hypothetical protein
METKMRLQGWATTILIFVIPIFILSLLAFSDGHNNASKRVINLNGNLYQRSNPSGWFITGASPASYSIGIDNLVSQHGHKCAFIESTVNPPKDFCTLMQFCSDQDFKGKRIKMTGYIKSQGQDETASMWIRIDDVNKNTDLDFDNMMDRPIVGTKDWTKCEIIFDVPDSKCVVNYGFILSGTGKIWVDNVSFETVSNSTIKTAHELREVFPSQYRIPEGLPLKPTNLDFEE